MGVREVCEGDGWGTDMTMQIEAVNSENSKGSGHVTAVGGGKSMDLHTNFTAKWLGAVCTEIE